MTESVLKLLTRSPRLLLLGCLLIASLSSAAAQGARNPKPIALDDKPSDEQGNRSFASIEEEMRAKRQIQIEEKEYQQNLEKARNLSFLGTSLETAFKEKNTLDREDMKKLDKVEKLAKNIRDAAGGSADEVQIEKPPADLAAALAMLADLSKSLKEKVERTPKHVISATLIDEANVLLEVIRIVRTFPPRA